MNADNGSGTDSTKTDSSGFSIGRLAPILALVAVAATVWLTGLHEYLSLESIAENRERLKGFVAENWIGAVALFIVVYAGVVALSLPAASLLTLLGGFLFGGVIGGMIVVVAATIGATIVFILAKTSLGEPLRAKAGPWLDKLSKGFSEDALNYLLFLRLVPAFPFWLVNLAPAFLGVQLPTFVIGTFFGIIPGSLAFAFLGAGLDSLIDAQRSAQEECLAKEQAGNLPEGEVCTFSLDPGALITTELLIAFAALGFAALVPIVVKKLRARKAS